MSAALANAYWLVFPAAISDEAACIRFKQKFGYPPSEIIRENGYVWSGPLATAEAKKIRSSEQSASPTL